MLISRRAGRLQLVTHPDHARAAGTLFEHWGNPAFEQPAHRGPLRLAAVHHDDGWRELDDRPSFSEEAGRPAHFLELPLPETVEPYARGVDEVYRRDVHAGALVSMHWAGLYRTRWGLQEGDPVGHPAASEVVAKQERRWVGALREAWGFRGLRSEFEADAWHAYEILQALDFISLAICLLDLEAPSTPTPAGPVGPPVWATLRAIDQPPDGRIIPRVPSARGGPYREISLWVPQPMTVALDPYPFADHDGFALELPVRMLSDSRHASADAAAAAYHAAPDQTLSVTVAPGPDGAPR